MTKVLRVAGFEVVRLKPRRPALKNYSFEGDETFAAVFRAALTACGSTHDPEIIHQRLYNATQFLRYTLDLEGDLVECGAFRGLWSYVFCTYIRLANPDFAGAGYHIFDSFEGLSRPSVQDLIVNPEYGPVGQSCLPEGSFQASLETVKATLRNFPHIDYHVGWIPQSFAGVRERQYKFVHIDLDLYDPIKGAIAYFYPRLVRGGVIIIDEYGFPRWPGAQKAVDEFCQENTLTPPVCLTTGNGVLIKK